MLDIHRFGKSLKEAREALGLQQHILARLSGVSRQRISSIENGKARDINLSTVCALDLALRQAESQPGTLAENIAPVRKSFGRKLR